MKKNRLVHTVVIGGGFAGLSTAYHLAKSGQKHVMVLEREKKLGGHASGNNAGMIRQAIPDPLLASLASEGRSALKKASQDGWQALDFQSNGSLLIAKGKGISELRQIAATLRRENIGHRWLEKKEAEQHVTLLKGADFEKALLCPSDAFVEIEALLNGFLRQLKYFKVPVVRGAVLQEIKNENGGFLLVTDKEIIFTRFIVNAAGAWAGEVGRMAGAQTISLKPYRRHLFESVRFKPFDAKWPFVWDLSHELYFRPIKGKSLLLSPCDQTRVSRRYTVARKERIDEAMEKQLLYKFKNFSAHFFGLKIKKAKSGLRTMSPDGRFVIGEDAKLKGFYWVAGLGGHGMTTSFSVGRFASDLILGREKNLALIRALSPARFSKKGLFL